MITRRHWTFATAGTAALAATAALAVTGSAQSGGTELHLTGTPQNHVGFFPKGHRPTLGSQLGFGDKITGDDHGVSRGVCTIVGGSGGLPCVVWVKLSRGNLALQSMLPERSHNTPVAVLGGTGAYNGARGTAYVTDVSASKTTITIDLLP